MILYVSFKHPDQKSLKTKSFLWILSQKIKYHYIFIIYILQLTTTMKPHWDTKKVII